MFTSCERAELEAIVEGEGIHTKKFQRCLAKVMAQYGDDKDSKSRAYAICTATFQKAGYLKRGTADLTKRGRKAMEGPAEGCECREAPLEERKRKSGAGPKKKLANALMGLTGGSIAASRAAAAIADQQPSNSAGRKRAQSLVQAAKQLQDTIERLKALSAAI